MYDRLLLWCVFLQSCTWRGRKRGIILYLPVQCACAGARCTTRTYLVPHCYYWRHIHAISKGNGKVCERNKKRLHQAAQKCPSISQYRVRGACSDICVYINVCMITLRALRHIYACIFSARTHCSMAPPWCLYGGHMARTWHFYGAYMVPPLTLHGASMAPPCGTSMGLAHDASVAPPWHFYRRSMALP